LRNKTIYFWCEAFFFRVCGPPQGGLCLVFVSYIKATVGYSECIASMLDDMTNMVEIMNRFMETSNITIMPKETRVHRLVILRLLYSFGASVDIAWSKEDLKETGVDIGDFNQKCTEV